MTKTTPTSPKKPMPFGLKVAINVLLMIVTGILLFWIATYWLDLWTRHGESIAVPDVKGLHYDAAETMLKNQDFEVVLQDSVYEEGVAPGTVVEQNPRAATNVKPGRTIYLTINAFYPRTVLLPTLAAISVRQARATLEGLGLKNIEIREVPSEFKDLVNAVLVDGRRPTPGQRVLLSARITLEVGAGLDDYATPTDSAAMPVDSISPAVITDFEPTAQPTEPIHESNSGTESDYFD